MLCIYELKTDCKNREYILWNSLFSWNTPYQKTLPPCRVQRWADSNVRQGKTVGIRRGTLFGGTQAEIYDRKGRFPSAERHDRQNEVSPYHRPKAHCRVVQGTIRQAKAEHTPSHTTAKERQGDETVIGLLHWETKKVPFMMSYEWHFFLIFAPKNTSGTMLGAWRAKDFRENTRKHWIRCIN